MKKIRAIVSTVKETENGSYIELEYETEITNYTDYYTHLKCSCFDIVTTKWKDDHISIFLDDEGLYKPNLGRHIENFDQALFGNLVICGGVDEKGNTLSAPEWLTSENVMNFISLPEYKTRY